MNWNRVEAILDDALTRPAEEREAFVAKACGSDETLRAEVLSLLKHVMPSTAFFSDLGGALATPPGTGPAAEYPHGFRIGRYRIEERIGTGGMGEVYRALDTVLERHAALKVIADRVAEGPTARERFYAEARAVAALDHPNVSAVYEVGEVEDGRAYIAMPLYEGPTLRHLLDERGSLPVAEASEYGAQIAGGLAEAHAQGIVHRDVKPSNVVVTRAGDAKLIDFGIASRGGDWRISSGSPGFGTVRYMAPERLVGTDAGPASDVWSLGVVLHELLAGEPPFTAHDRRELVERIVRGRPAPLRSLRPDVPRDMERLVAKCLSADAADRPRAERVAELLGAPTESPARGWRGIEVGAAATLATALLASPLLTSGDPDLAGVDVPILVPRPHDQGRGSTWLELSDDGNQLLVVSAGLDPLRLTDLTTGDQRTIQGTQRAFGPALSPDGTQVAFGMFRGVHLAPVAGGGSTVVIEDVPFNFLGLEWSGDSTLLIGGPEGVHEISVRGPAPGTTRRISTPTGVEIGHRYPRPLPGGRLALVEVSFEPGAGSIRPGILDLDSGELSYLASTGRSPQFAEGHVLYTVFSTLHAVPFDPLRGIETGRHMRLPLDVSRRTFASDFVVAGKRLLFSRPGDPAGLLVRVDPTGEERFVPWANSYRAPRYSHDGLQLIGQYNIPFRMWHVDVETRELVQVNTAGAVSVPQFAWDDRSILYQASAEDPREGMAVWEIDWPERGPRRRVTDGGVHALGPRTEWLIGYRPDFGDWRAWNRVSGDTVTVVPRGRSFVRGDISPDGRWFAYSVREGGTEQVWIQSFPHPGERVRLTHGGGIQARWAGDGRTLYYRDGRSMVALDMAFDPVPTVVRRRELFGDEYDVGAQYDVHPTREEFVMVRHRDPHLQIQTIPDWTVLLREAQLRFPRPGD